MWVPQSAACTALASPASLSPCLPPPQHSRPQRDPPPLPPPFPRLREAVGGQLIRMGHSPLTRVWPALCGTHPGFCDVCACDSPNFAYTAVFNVLECAGTSVPTGLDRVRTRGPALRLLHPRPSRSPFSLPFVQLDVQADITALPAPAACAWLCPVSLLLVHVRCTACVVGIAGLPPSIYRCLCGLQCHDTVTTGWHASWSAGACLVLVVTPPAAGMFLTLSLAHKWRGGALRMSSAGL